MIWHHTSASRLLAVQVEMHVPKLCNVTRLSGHLTKPHTHHGRTHDLSEPLNPQQRASQIHRGILRSPTHLRGYEAKISGSKGYGEFLLRSRRTARVVRRA